MGYEINKPDFDLDLAPMIDVVFLLLIFFIVASTLNLEEVKSEIQLPDTEVVESTQETKINVAITKDGRVYLGERNVQLEELGYLLEDELRDTPQNSLAIFADQEVEFQNVIEVMDIAKKVGIKNLNFALQNR
ncbi:biopolymer transporter ExbD [Natroniella acetigena]|uniref:ExbD/TolR family protein n=1 Tax=Natroniella acetigena TaxID=52004 RepID=UPI00200AF4F1|nr:biopolymer transporter ExbD [Natroniella acetigena]MCK8826558.1 biopolymer transporter ExbD [Natroniella acetigena]